MEKAEDADDGALGGMEKRAATHLRALFANNVPVCVRLHGQGRDLLGKPLDTPHCQCLVTSQQHRHDERPRLDRIAERRARAVRLIERQRVDRRARIL